MINPNEGCYIPPEVYRLRLDMTVMNMLVLGKIHTMHQNGKCNARNKYFAEHFGLKKRQVINILNWLQDNGYIESKIVNPKTNERELISLVQPNTPPSAIDCTTPSVVDCTKEVQEDALPLVQSTTHNNTNSINTKDNIKKNNSHEVELWPLFDDFYDLYDKKVERVAAEKAWKKVKQTEREKLMEHVPVYVASTPEKKYRKNPATYLNGKCWEDEIIYENGQSKQQTANNRKGYHPERFNLESLEQKLSRYANE